MVLFFFSKSEVFCHFLSPLFLLLLLLRPLSIPHLETFTEGNAPTPLSTPTMVSSVSHRSTSHLPSVQSREQERARGRERDDECTAVAATNVAIPMLFFRSASPRRSTKTPASCPPRALIHICEAPALSQDIGATTGRSESRRRARESEREGGMKKKSSSTSSRSCRASAAPTARPEKEKKSQPRPLLPLFSLSTNNRTPPPSRAAPRWRPGPPRPPSPAALPLLLQFPPRPLPPPAAAARSRRRRRRNPSAVPPPFSPPPPPRSPRRSSTRQRSTASWT